MITRRLFLSSGVASAFLFFLRAKTESFFCVEKVIKSRYTSNISIKQFEHDKKYFVLPEYHQTIEKLLANGEMKKYKIEKKGNDLVLEIVFKNEKIFRQLMSQENIIFNKDKFESFGYFWTDKFYKS